MQRPTTSLLVCPAAVTLVVTTQPEPTSLKLIHSSYVLGPDYQLPIRALDVREMSEKPVPVATSVCRNVSELASIPSASVDRGTSSYRQGRGG